MSDCSLPASSPSGQDTDVDGRVGLVDADEDFLTFDPTTAGEELVASDEEAPVEVVIDVVVEDDDDDEVFARVEREECEGRRGLSCMIDVREPMRDPYNNIIIVSNILPC